MKPPRPRPPCLALAAIIAIGLHSLAAGAASDTAPPVAPSGVTSAPPADVVDGFVVPQLTLAGPAGAPARRIALPAPDARALAESLAPSRRAANASARDKTQPLAIGIGRELPAEARMIALAGLAWSDAGAGQRTARIEVVSPGAAAVRVALLLPAPVPGLVLRFTGSAAGARVFGAVPAAAVAEASTAQGQYWTPILAGEVAVIELAVSPGTAIDGVALAIPRISHAVIDGADLFAPLSALARASGIGDAGACNIDVACIAPTNPAAAELAKSMALLAFVADDGHPYVCTGTLIGDSLQTNTPYLLSASHCLESAMAARTLNTYWFYAAATCNAKDDPPFVQLTGGATLLGRSRDNDWSIVRLNQTPPAGTKLAAWRAEPIANGTTVVSLHHPAGDLLKYSRGTVTATVPIIDDYVYGTYTEVVWSEGVTEAGSSGGPLATLAPGGAYYEVRGGLYAGFSACKYPQYPDYYSHLDLALPLMRQYLTPNSGSPTGAVAAVEFYHRGLDHYFLSTNPVEIDNLDSGRTVGWERTGLRFLVYDHPVAGTSPVCRFYRAPAYGDSHFYSASPAECAQTAAAHPVDWVYESPNVFYVALPDTKTGSCPAATVAVYRFFNFLTTNHRYTVERAVRNELAESFGWTAEGYGPGPYFPIMCAAAQ